MHIARVVVVNVYDCVIFIVLSLCRKQIFYSVGIRKIIELELSSDSAEIAAKEIIEFAKKSNLI
jgi:hypothetical protein